MSQRQTNMTLQHTEMPGKKVKEKYKPKISWDGMENAIFKKIKKTCISCYCRQYQPKIFHVFWSTICSYILNPSVTFTNAS